MLPDRSLARQIVENLGSYGIPVARGVSYYDVGNDSLLNTLDEHYLKSYLANGGGAFKLIIGKYGSGKSHFLYRLQELAWSRNFAVSMVSLNSKETPYSDHKLVYRAVASHLTWTVDPSGQKGVSHFVKAALNTLLAQKGFTLSTAKELESPQITALLESFNSIQLDSVSFRSALIEYAKSLFGEPTEQHYALADWLDGQESTTNDMRLLRPFGIEKITRNNGFKMLRSLCQTVRALNYTGLALLFDEGDRLLTGTKRFTRDVADNLREVIDYCREGLPGALFVYAVPPEFISQVVDQYQALKQRISTPYTFSVANHFSPQIRLEDLETPTEDLLIAMGTKLLPIFELAQGVSLDKSIQDKNIRVLAKAAADSFYETHPRRLFVKAIISEWNQQLARGEQEINQQRAEQLIRVEQAAINAPDEAQRP